MSLHQFATDGRKRLTVSQSKTEPGKVVLQLLDSAREVIAVYSMDASTAAVIGQAFGIEAVAAENAALVEVAARRCGCGSVFPKCGASNCAGRDIREAQKAVRKIGPALVQAYADTNGFPQGRVLPVVDVPPVSGLCKLIDKINAEKVGA